MFRAADGREDCFRSGDDADGCCTRQDCTLEEGHNEAHERKARARLYLDFQEKESLFR